MVLTLVAGVIFVLWFYKSVDWVRHLIDVGEDPWNLTPYKSDPYNPKREISDKTKKK